MEIRSYRRVFDLERRIYRVDRLRLNPGGVPVRGVLYFVAILIVALVVGRLSFVGTLANAVPWYLRDLLLPGASAAVLSVIRIEGRPFHLAARALLRYQIGPRWLSGGCRCAAPGGDWHPEEILMLPDGSDSKVRRLRYTGPGAVLIAVEHERRVGRVRGRGSSLGLPGRRPAVIVRELADAGPLPRAQVLALAAHTRLVVRSAAGKR
jgi:hypothetical protein